MKDREQISFEDRLGQFEKELRLHCYRLTGSLLDSEDLLQETLLKAWKKKDSLREESKLRPWLYRIATNVCLDHLKSQQARAMPKDIFKAAGPKNNLPSPYTDLPWLEPFPDSLIPNHIDNPEAAIIKQEELSLAFLTSIQLLPARQRAVLILIDVLDWSPQETAEALGYSLSSINSRLYRARKSLRGKENKSIARKVKDEEEKVLLKKFLNAWESSDVEGLSQLLSEDAIFQMPPFQSWFNGRAEITEMIHHHLFDSSEVTRWKLSRFDANRKPAYLLSRLDEKTLNYGPFGLMMVSANGGYVSEIVAFLNPLLISFIQKYEREVSLVSE